MSETAPTVALSVDDQIEAAERKLAEKAKARETARQAQYLVDLEARIELEDEWGELAGVQTTRFVEGQPTRAYVRVPDAGEYKKYKSQVYANAQGKKGSVSLQEAQELLARACWVYPKTKDAQAEMLAKFPGLLTPLSIAAASLAEGKAEEAGKD